MKFILVAIFVIYSSLAWSMDSTDLLPSRVNNTQLRYGVMDGADKKFDSSGSLINQVDANSMNFGTQQIISLNSDARRLIEILNQQGHANLGNQLNLGTLKIDTRPEVRYFAPVLARGITRRLTVAAAVPIVSYKNTISLSESGSNVNAIKQQAGDIGAEGNAAFARMQMGVVHGLRTTLEENGYKPLQSREESLIGDLQLHGLYSLYSSGKFSTISRTVVSLPTGKQDDPDDLADLGTYGELAFEQGLLANYKVLPRTYIAGKAAYKFVAPRNSDVRVPKDENDALPAANRKETVIRDGGDVTTFGASGTYNLNDEINFGTGLDYSYKQRDRISGSHSDWNYALLENKSEQSAVKARLGAEYSTTTAYTKGRASIPLKVGYEFTNTLAGKNSLNTMTHELALSLFF